MRYEKSLVWGCLHSRFGSPSAKTDIIYKFSMNTTPLVGNGRLHSICSFWMGAGRRTCSTGSTR